MLRRLWKLYGLIETGKWVYGKVLKPIYAELKKDAELLENHKQQTTNKSKNVIDKKLNRSYKRKGNTKKL